MAQLCVVLLALLPANPPTMEPPLPSRAPELKYLGIPLRLLHLTLSLLPKARTQTQPLNLNLALFVSLFVSLSVSQPVPILLLYLSLSQILFLPLSLPPPVPLWPQSLILTTLTQILAQSLTQTQT